MNAVTLRGIQVRPSRTEQRGTLKLHTMVDVSLTETCTVLLISYRSRVHERQGFTRRPFGVRWAVLGFAVKPTRHEGQRRRPHPHLLCSFCARRACVVSVGHAAKPHVAFEVITGPAHQASQWKGGVSYFRRQSSGTFEARP